MSVLSDQEQRVRYLAKELVESGKSVCYLERGGYYEGKDMNQRECGHDASSLEEWRS